MEGSESRLGQPVYSIGAVARMVGVPTATLRTWQERYEVVVPTRSEGGHRLYSRDQVEQLRFVADQVGAGLAPADAHRLLREQVAGDRAGAALTTKQQPQQTLLILLAERDRYAAEFSEYFLRTEGYEVTLALELDDALGQAHAAPPDLVVVDLMISAGRGLELCQRLADQSHAPVLAISTLRLRDAALAAGAAGFISKPLEPLQFISAVQDLLGRSAFLQRERTAP